MSGPLLEVRDLRVSFSGHRGTTVAVRGVSFELGRERLGIVGESGSGKSQTARALLGLSPGTVSARRLAFAGRDLLGLDRRGWRSLRGRHLGLILQDPRYSLNPVMRVGRQLVEAWRAHHRGGRGQARCQALEMLARVQLRDPERVFRAYPHELSGGMGQRVMIAMMLLGGPELLIADEPTSALDVTLRREVLGVLDRQVRERGMGLILISHDLDLVAGFCDRVLVMYAGRVLEVLPAGDLHRAQHPYTRGLLACVPRLDTPGRELPVLVRDPAWGEVPDAGS